MMTATRRMSVHDDETTYTAPPPPPARVRPRPALSVAVIPNTERSWILRVDGINVNATCYGIGCNRATWVAGYNVPSTENEAGHCERKQFMLLCDRCKDEVERMERDFVFVKIADVPGSEKLPSGVRSIE